MVKIFTHAFGMIELLVAVAIVGILAAVAIPAYNTYAIKAKIQIGMNYVSGLTEYAQTYYAQNGTFPTIEYDQGNNPPSSYVSPYVRMVAVEPQSGSTCNYVAVGATIADLDSRGDFFVTGSGLYGDIYKFKIDVNGVMQDACEYYLSDSTTGFVMDPNYIPNCVNMMVNTNIYNSITALANTCP